ncbi:TolC family protein [Campylobacter geochelonis]|uniref:TolC family protein n=1 Tax=Campylobacter geochelonis TaxID=1780362 RepID=UPI000770A395|nr:TolC family protein [Campylobacter geochelonis]CZE47913.1 outer membrane efflux protein [Campylobacter geochelonis]CZE50810.1 outer membrane efflux protein [Campylobacter geochelonis]
MIKNIIQNYFINVDKKGFKTYFKFKILFIKLAGTIKKILFKSIKTIFIFLTTIFLTSGFAADKNYDLSTVSNTNKQKSTKFDYLNDAFDGAKDLDVDYKSSIKKRYPSYMGDKFSFDSLLEFTLLNSPGINLAKIDVLSALNEFDYARANYYPELGISANTEYSKRFDSGVNSVYIGNDSLSSQTTYSNSLSLVLRYDLFKFGADYYAAEAARENITNTRYKKCVYELNTSLNLLESYYEVLMYKNRVDIYEKLKNLYKMLYNYQKRLLKAGEIDKLALANSAISLADTSYELEELWLNANNSLSKLNAISGAKVKDISLLDDFGLNDTNLGFNKFEDTIIAKQFDYELMQNELALKAEEKLKSMSDKELEYAIIIAQNEAKKLDIEILKLKSGK